MGSVIISSEEICEVYVYPCKAGQPHVYWHYSDKTISIQVPLCKSLQPRSNNCVLLGLIWRHKSDGGSTLKQNTVIRVSILFVLCINLVFGGKYMEFRIIFPLQYSISISTFEVDPVSDSLHNAIVNPKNIII